jgi:hypothetical protein
MNQEHLMKRYKIGLVVCLTLWMAACGKPEKPQNLAGLNDFSQSQLVTWNKNLSDVIITDIFTPPVASRIYAYPNIAAYEALVPAFPEYQTLAGQLNGLEALPAPEAGKEYYFPVASVIAFSKVGQKFVLSQDRLEEKEAAYLQKIKDIGIGQEVLENSIAYGNQVADHIIAWALKDNYTETRALTRHVLTAKPEVWQPTPPDYMPAVEPHWGKMRPFVLDSAAQCKPLPTTAFDSLPGSKFHQEVMEIYHLSKNLTEEQKLIAQFWDDNPNISYTKGHVTFFKQKLTPAGHWLSITSDVIEDRSLGLMQAAETYVYTTTALADAFISCWDAKFTLNTIRPDTYIQRYVDPNWEPLLQTPPFPEYPSGHTVISAAAATALTHLFGDSYAFTDSTQLVLGLPVRKFNSFYEASNEAGLSRLYGGIHFSPANVLGRELGKEVGRTVISSLKTRADKGMAQK